MTRKAQSHPKSQSRKRRSESETVTQVDEEIDDDLDDELDEDFDDDIDDDRPDKRLSLSDEEYHAGIAAAMKAAAKRVERADMELGGRRGARLAAQSLLSHQGFTPSRLKQISASGYEWIWRGFLARGQTTLLVSQWKTGKTTLLSVLLKKLEAGGELAGQTVSPARTLVVSEEDPTRWHERFTALGIGEHCTFICRPEVSKDRNEVWPHLIQAMTEGVQHRGYKLVVIDTLSSFLPPCFESNPQAMRDALAWLKPVTAARAAVLILHHPAKGHARAGQTARGTGLLTAVVDINLELSLYRPGILTDRRRKLQGWSRHQSTPHQAVIEWTEDGTDYRHLGNFEDAGLIEEWQSLRAVFAASPTDLTAHDLYSQWPLNLGDPPTTRTVYRRLEAAVAAGLLTRLAPARRLNSDNRPQPFRYRLADKTEKPDESQCDPVDGKIELNE